MPGPIYYCPPGVPRPAHIRHEAPNALLPGIAPAGVPESAAGGMLYGGAFDAEHVYQPTSAGWYVHLRGDSRDIVRRNRIPGYDVAGFLVPRLVDLHGAPVVGFFDASGFRVPDPLLSIVDRLQALLQSTDLDHHRQPTPEHAQLAADILAVNFCVSLHELGLGQHLTPSTVWAIITAAVSIPPDAG